MKRTLAILMFTVICAVISAGCSSSSKVDFDSPNAVIEATLAAHPIQEGEIYGIYDDLKGKTVSVKTNNYKENDIVLLYDGLYNSNTVNVFIGGLYDSSGKPLTDFDYKKGDTVVVEIDSVDFRGTKNGKLREYFINTVLPDKTK
ncbi:MAG: hypothetical protein II936_09740 [Oscillospiraceae bacterium]|nr:hypothetical protein [Oscillospiraceae bacterium]